MSLSKFSVNNPVAVNLIMWMMVVAGIYYAFNLVREIFPNSEPEQISISVAYPGASPGDVEKAITRRMEREIEDVDGIEEIRSSVLEGVSLTTIEVDDDFDKDVLLNDVRGEVDKVIPKLPRDAEEPELNLIRPFFPVITVNIHGNVEEARLREAARDLKEELLDLPEVSRVFVTGVREPEIQVEILPEKLEEYDLTFAEVGRRLQRLNLDLPGGTLENATGNIGVRTVGEETRALGLENHIVASRPDGTNIRLRDIARVRETFESRVERGRFDGKPAVALTVQKTPEEDAIEISDAVKRFIAERPERMNRALDLDFSSDLSRFIAQRLDLMTRNAKAGLILVAIALALFLQLRVAFWVAVGLPISFLGTFVMMHFMGGSINLISLFALIVVIGLIVDDAIVIGENVFTKMRMGLPAKQAAIEGANEVAVPVVSAVLTTIVAFLPLAFIEGNIGTFMRQLPIVVIAALSVSLIEAFMILPAHLAHEPRNKESRWRIVRMINARLVAMRAFLFETTLPRYYEKALRHILRWRYLAMSVVTAFAMVVFGLVAGGLIPFVLIQESDAETLTVEVEMAAGTPESRTLQVIQQLEDIVLESEEVDTVFALLGATFSDRGRQTPADPATVGQLTVELKPSEVREDRNMRSSDRLLAEWRSRAGEIEGANRIAFRARSGGPQGADIEVRVRGEDLSVLEGAVEKVKATIESYGVDEVETDFERGKLEVRLSLRDDARELGLTTADVAEQVRNALFGFEIQELQNELEEVKVRVLLPEAARRDIGDLARLRIVTPEGARVPLEEVAILDTQRGYASIALVDGDRAFTVKAEVDDAKMNTSQVTKKLTKEFATLSKEFPGVSVTFEGAKKQTNESLSSLKLGFPAALFMIYIIIAVLFRSYLQPFMVMMAIPFAFVGAIWGHYVTGYPFTILSLIGGVALAGIVVNDSLILVDFTNRARRVGASAFEAVIAGGKSRLRAILLTSITTISGLAPLMLERSFQAQFLIPMAVSIVYGLAFATILTLFVLPCVYCTFEDIGRFVTGKRALGEGEGEALPDELQND